ncbi:ASCH domain-containing protein [Klebsiella aerogenes]|uniref:hypothetical protein n=1 Tax=Klebsiella aerogenes TaxID=548 RepID=UPI00063C1410|nr:hypothetical protein [Klebsiella aerogenes]KLF44688.1 hypothetical protein YA32_06180 [Klebsiella aerogenes]
MTERGMIFNGEMVRAILDGRKTQTRRIMKPQPEPCPRGGHWWPSNVFKTMLHIEEEMQNGKGVWGGLVGDACPFGDVGDRIWVRETWARYNIDQDSHDMAYRATTPEDWPEGGRWRQSIHMPRWASRILLEITDVRVERLNTISEEDAQREGVHTEVWDQTVVARNYADSDEFFQFWSEDMPHYVEMNQLYRSSFRSLWDSIYGEESWKANGWVWVIEFKRVEGGAA